MFENIFVKNIENISDEDITKLIYKLMQMSLTFALVAKFLTDKEIGEHKVLIKILCNLIFENKKDLINKNMIEITKSIKQLKNENGLNKIITKLKDSINENNI